MYLSLLFLLAVTASHAEGTALWSQVLQRVWCPQVAGLLPSLQLLSLQSSVRRVSASGLHLLLSSLVLSKAGKLNRATYRVVFHLPSSKISWTAHFVSFLLPCNKWPQTWEPRAAQRRGPGVGGWSSTQSYPLTSRGPGAKVQPEAQGSPPELSPSHPPAVGLQSRFWLAFGWGLS